MADTTDIKKAAQGIINPKGRLRRQMDEAGVGDEDAAMPDPKKGVNRGDLPGPGTDFFKPREKKGGPPAELLRRHYEKK